MKKGRLVVKIGSSSLAKRNGSIDHKSLINYANAVSHLHASGYEVVLISSGAVAAGFQKIGYRTRPITTVKKQAAAAVGQGLLMEAYEKAFSKNTIAVAQLLLTRESFVVEEQYDNAYATLEELLRRGVVPIINENDSIAIEELTFGDNDWLSSLVAGLIRADMLILLTDVNGVYNKHPSSPDAVRYSTITDVTDDLYEQTASTRSTLGTGGMRSKLEAAKRAQQLGIRTFIGQARDTRSLEDAVHSNGDGTYVDAGHTPWTKGKQWVGLHSPVEGAIMIDNGAKQALLHDKKSLLTVGIVDVIKTFPEGAVIDVCDQDGHTIGRGRSAVSSDQIKTTHYNQLCIHRNHWVSYVNGGE
ncbi:LOW QUALITY PROTEIN: glutamate 5-kinase [Geomicrobium sp. JCM 19039]|nr:LOW QUALITY PROTEIN: glutamate 5-kinase [Geomicrobium sp. JCM 19039]